MALKLLLVDSATGKHYMGGEPTSPTPMATKTSAYTAVAGDRLFADTSGGAFTITLPPTPSFGDTILIYDPKGTWDANNVTVGRNGSNIDGVAENLTLDLAGGKVELIYFDASQGWKAY